MFMLGIGWSVQFELTIFKLDSFSKDMQNISEKDEDDSISDDDGDEVIRPRLAAEEVK